MSDTDNVALEAARRIVAAHDGVEKAKQETHPSFKDAVLALTYHEIHASAREGALIVARALLNRRAGLEAVRREVIQAAIDDVLSRRWSDDREVASAEEVTDAVFSALSANPQEGAAEGEGQGKDHG